MLSEWFKPTQSGSMVLSGHGKWLCSYIPRQLGSRTLVRQSPGPDSLGIWISSQTQQKYTVVHSGLIRSLLATSHTNPTGIGTSDSGPAESEAGLARNMDIFSNPTKVHGRILWANPFTISHSSHKSQWYWDVGRPEWISGSIPTTAPWSRTGWPVGLHPGYQNIRLIPENNISHNRNILSLSHRIPFTDRSLSFRVLINSHT